MTDYHLDAALSPADAQLDEDQERESRYRPLMFLGKAAWVDATSNLSPLLRGAKEGPAGQTLFSGYGIRNSRVTVSENELYLDTSVNEGGMFYISSGGAAVRTTVNGFGDDFDPAGGMHVFDGGTADDTTVGGYFAFLHVSSGGVANRVAIDYDGCVLVSSGGIVNGATVNTGGWLHVSSGGVINGVTVSNLGFGALHISSGGTATGRIVVENRANVTVFRGAVLDFDVSVIEPGAEARINDITRISDWWEATYTLTVSGTQPDGTYTLADYAEDFNMPLVVRGTAGERYGTLQTGGVLLIGNSRYSLTLDGSNTLTMTKEIDSEVFNSELIVNGLPFGIGSGRYTKNVIGGTSVEASGDPAEVGGNTSLVIDGGEFSRNLFCGDRVLSGSLIRNGDINSTINGGTFDGYVAGGLCFNQKTNSERADLNGNVRLTITGGTFDGKGIYGGCIAADQNSSALTKIDGNVTTVFRSDAGSAISVKGHVYAGSYRLGRITGDVSLVFSGGGMVGIGGELWGGCSGDYYEIGGEGNRTFVSSIDEDTDRLLSFAGFTGDLTCQKIRGFESIEFVWEDGIATHAALSGGGYDLSDIRNWTFEYGCDAQGSDFANDFTGEILTLTGLPGEEDFTDWTILTNSRAGAFAGFGDGLTVYLGAQEMSWDSTQKCFLGGGCRLALDETSSSVGMILSKLA